MNEPSIADIEWYNQKVTFERINKSMYHEQFDIHDLGVSSRVFTHWKKEDLIPFIQVRKRVKLNVYEYFWIQILKDLRSLGYPLALLREFKNHCFYQFTGGGGKKYIDQHGNEVTLPKDRRFNSEGELKLVTDTELMTNQNACEEPTKEALDFLRLSGEDMSLSIACNLLNFIINETVISGKDIKLFVSRNGFFRYNGIYGARSTADLVKDGRPTDEAFEDYESFATDNYSYTEDN